ncbi:hypothetical protein JXA32_15120, partial [Candidatus Sumerlaeota bacterium]|nr:hypothetical protein [Candidatus Sumerlaeota bacterium]
MRTIICVLTGLLLIASSLDSPVFALFGDGAAAESAAPAAGIHPAPRTIHMNGRTAEFANPALVVPIDLAGTLAAERMKQALAEFGMADIPVLSEDAPIFKHDCVFYIGMHYPRCPTLASMRKRGFGDAPDRNRRQAYVLMTAPIDVERALPAQVFLLANSMPAMHSAIESLRQTLANYNP